MWKINIDKEKCTGCGECAESCPGDVYEMVDGVPVPVNLDECHGCHTCEAVCDEDAIEVSDEDD
jgi:NAD-dependent dihydropyrimidine dehydrogenase PreA subunit